MLNKVDIANIKKAAKSVKNENHTFFISGKDFSCRWNGKNFVWTAPSGQKYDCTAKEVLAFIGDGKEITDFCYDYNN